MSNRRKKSQAIVEAHFNFVDAVLRRRSRKMFKKLCRQGICPLVLKERIRADREKAS